MKPEDRRRLKQHIDMIVNHNAPSVTFCPNCECERETTLYSEVRECTFCMEEFEVVGGIKPSNSDVSMTENVLTDVKTPSSIANTNPDYYKGVYMQCDKRIDELMIPVLNAINRHVKDRDAKTDIYNRAYEAIIISMEENAALREQVRWIPVSDKKPPEQDFVLCYAPEYDSVEIRRTDLIGQAITHWMPLPQPPEGE